MRLLFGAALMAVTMIGHAQADVVTVLPNTTWGSIPNENSAGASATIDGTRPYSAAAGAGAGTGSVELIGDRTRFTNGNYYNTSGTGLYNVNSVSALTFAWQVASDSANPYNPDYTPALRFHIYDPATTKRSELIWEGAYNNVYRNETKDTWYLTGTNDLFYQNVSGNGVTLNNGAQVNQTVAAWVPSYSPSAVITAISVGDGSGASPKYHAFVDDVSVYFANGNTTTYDFEVSGATSVPEPASVVLLGVGLGALIVRRRRRH